MRVFITGGSGFVGGHLIEAVTPDHEVFALARSERSAGIVAGYGATAVSGSLETVTAGDLDGVDVVVHVAAYVEEWGPDEAYWAANVEGTQRMLDVAREAGVKRFIQVSTNATVHDGAGQLGIDEAAPYPAHDSWAYGRTKAEAERRVLAANTPDFATVALRPCFIWGPRDTTLAPALGRMVDEGNFVWLDGGRAQVSTTHVFNLISAIQAVLETGGEGEAFFIADREDRTIRQFLTDIATEQGVTLPNRSVPGVVVRGLAKGLEFTWRTLGLSSTPPVTHMAAMLMSKDMTVDTSRAQHQLRWTPGSADELAKQR